MRLCSPPSSLRVSVAVSLCETLALNLAEGLRFEVALATATEADSDVHQRPAGTISLSGA